MRLVLSEATPADADQIVHIHMEVFGSNQMLVAQFPTVQGRENLKRKVKRSTLADMADPHATVLVVRAIQSNRHDSPQAGQEECEAASSHEQVVGYARWSHPLQQQDHDEPLSNWPKETNFDMLTKWFAVVAKAQEKVLGRQACYRLNFIGTDPRFERMGVASLMLQWGLDKSKRTGVPLYLESTIEAVPFYSRKGFVPVGTLSLTVPKGLVSKEAAIYKEVSFLYQSKPKLARGIKPGERCEDMASPAPSSNLFAKVISN